ncbi:MAG: hypothetical protein JRI36_14110 [Deltaproteobacteria bacterium]|nr:hypothetical protein [Deltaproteobacteria bacterium]
MDRTRLIAAMICMGLLLSVPCYATNDPFNPTPSDGAIGVDTTTTLQWGVQNRRSGSYPLSFEVWMRRLPDNWGTTSLDKLDLALVGTLDPIEDPDRELTLNCLMPDTTYVWQVVSIDVVDTSTTNRTEGPRWTFTTNSTVGKITGVEPNPVEKGETLRIHGCGFLAGTPVKVKLGSRAAKRGTLFGDRTIVHWDDSLIVLKVRKGFFTKNGIAQGNSGDVTVKVILKDGADRIKYVYSTPKLTLEWP